MLFNLTLISFFIFIFSYLLKKKRAKKGKGIYIIHIYIQYGIGKKINNKNKVQFYKLM